MRSPSLNHLFAVAGLLIGGALGLAQPAQQLDSPQRGIAPTGSYTVSQVESISNTFGGLNVSIPVGGLAPGRAGFSYPVNLNYNSQIYDTYPAVEYPDVERHGTRMVVSKDGGWQYGYQYKVLSDQRILTSAQQSSCSLAPIGSSSALSQPPGEDQLAIKRYRLRVVFPDGSVHLLHPKYKMERTPLAGSTQSDGTLSYVQDLDGDGFYNISINKYYVPLFNNSATCYETVGLDLPQTMVYYTTDGSYVRIEFTTKVNVVGYGWVYFQFDDMNWTMYFPDGKAVYGRGGFSNYEYDRNGNAARILNTTQNGVPTTTVDDQLGRIVKITFGANQDQITSKGYTGVDVTTNVNWAGFSLSNSLWYDCSQTSAGGATLIALQDCPATGIANPNVATGALPFRMVSSIQLPTNGTGAQDFSFRYSGQFFNTPQGWGELYEMTLPSGLKVNYNYLYDGQNRYNLRENPIVGKIVTDSIGPEITTYDTCNNLADPFYCGTRTEHTPDGGTTQYSFTTAFGIPYPPLVKTISSPGSEIRKVWSYNKPFPRELYTPAVQRTFQFDNPIAQYEYRIPKVGLSSGLASATKTTIDANGNTTQVDASDWFASSSITSSNGFWQPLDGIYSRSQSNTYAVPVPNAATSDHVDAYWNENTASPRTTLNALSSTTINATTTGTIYSKTEFTYADARNKANVQYERRYKDASNYLQTAKEYDVYGNLTRVTDPRNVVTDIPYATIDGFPNAFPQTQKQASGTTNQLQTDFTYDRYTGRVKDSTTYRSTAASTTFAIKTVNTYDIFGRILTSTQTGSSPGLANLSRSSSNTYNDGPLNVVSRRDLTNLSDGLLQVSQTYDQKYRPSYSFSRDDDGTLGIRTDQSYKVATGGLYSLASTPYRSTGDVTLGWNYSQTDISGRLVEKSHYAGYGNKPAIFGGTGTTPSSLSTITYNIANGTTYKAFETAVTTKGGATLSNTTNASDMSRTTGVDGFGQIISASESGSSLSTSYAYDPAGRLTTVTQTSGASTQKRVFKYDWLGRLTDVYQPETNAANPSNPEFLTNGSAATPAFHYTYDGNGNLETRTDARGVVTTYTYDELNRLTGKSYQNASGTPSVGFSYSGPDALQSVTLNGVTAATYTYDQFGRTLTSAQTTNNVTYNFGTSSADPGYQWNLADNLKQVKYPGGKTVATTPSSAGRYTAATVNGTNYASLATYTPGGALKQMTLGTSAIETRGYNSLGQMESIKVDKSTTNLLTLTNNYKTTNTGNLDDQKLMPLGAQQYFSYNAKNQLTGVQEKNLQGTLLWQEAYDATEFGNHFTTAAIVTGGQRPNSASWFDLSNRLAGVAHDAAGNQTFVSPFTAAYDGESRQSGVTSVNNGSATYFYDGNGRRVMKTASGVTTVFVYDTLGRLAQEYSSGQVVLGGTRYLTQDQLGSTRMVTDASGGDVRYFDFLPFGEEIPTGNGGRTTTLGYGKFGTSQKYTGQERDQETGLDFMGARYASTAIGRFTSLDIPRLDQHQGEPQSWNLYSYVRNNPSRYIDPSGRACVYGGSGNIFDQTSYSDDNNGGQNCKDAFSRSSEASSTITSDGSYFNSSGGVLTLLDDSGQAVAPSIEYALIDQSPNISTAGSFLGMAAIFGKEGGNLASRTAARMGLRAGEDYVFGGTRNINMVSIGLQLTEGELTATVGGLFGNKGAAKGAALLELAKGLMRTASEEGANTLRVVANQVGNGELAKGLKSSGFRQIGEGISPHGLPFVTLEKTFKVR